MAGTFVYSFHNYSFYWRFFKSLIYSNKIHINYMLFRVNNSSGPESNAWKGTPKLKFSKLRKGALGLRISESFDRWRNKETCNLWRASFPPPLPIHCPMCSHPMCDTFIIYVVNQVVQYKWKHDPLTVTVIIPSFPTFSIARAISSPISRSPLAEIVATCQLCISM